MLKRADLNQLTATFGTAQPPRGLSGALRRYAFTLPDHRPRHWAVLLLADRVDVLETAAAELVRRRPVVTAFAALFLVGAAVALGGKGKRKRTRTRKTHRHFVR